MIDYLVDFSHLDWPSPMEVVLSPLIREILVGSV
jgi:hypothetical protein